jgi:hypothetical protein
MVVDFRMVVDYQMVVDLVSLLQQ